MFRGCHGDWRMGKESDLNKDKVCFPPNLLREFYSTKEVLQGDVQKFLEIYYLEEF